MKQLEPYVVPAEMDRFTGIDPVHAADVTLHALRNYFGREWPADFAGRLVRRLELAYERDARRGKQDKWARLPEHYEIFFRRWLAELLFQERRDLFWRLPPGYRYGEPIWPESHAPKPAPLKPLPEPPKLEPAEIIRPVPKTVRQSLPFIHGAELLAA